MSAPPGWYPDPSGQSGRFRYWDGQGWSATTTTDPRIPPPAVSRVSTGAAGRATPTAGLSGPGPGPSVRGTPGRVRLSWILGAIGGLAVIVVAVVLIVRLLSPSTPDDPTPPPNDPTSSSTSPDSSPTTVSCPGATTDSQPPASTGDRVVSGKLSYPRLGSPFSAPFYDKRVPFGRDVQSQQVVLERSADGKASWGADVLIARLLAGDGFFGPEQGSQIVVSCVLGSFYGDAAITRHDIKNTATMVDGHQAWLVESKLSYHVPGVKATSELMIVEVIATAPGEGGLFYASMPDTAPTLQPKALSALAGLRVS